MLGSQVGDGAKCKECGRLFVRTASDKQALCPHCVMAWLNDICECGGSHHYAEHLRHCPYIKRTTGTPKGEGDGTTS
jgi:hypothetical protein